MRLSFLIIILIITSVSYAQTPNLDYPYFITNDGGYLLENNIYSSPFFSDWDDDGDLDLFVGVMFYGNIHYYENTSHGVIPEFADFVLIEADGLPIQVSYS